MYVFVVQILKFHGTVYKNECTDWKLQGTEY